MRRTRKRRLWHSERKAIAEAALSASATVPNLDTLAESLQVSRCFLRGLFDEFSLETDHVYRLVPVDGSVDIDQDCLKAIQEPIPTAYSDQSPDHLAQALIYAFAQLQMEPRVFTPLQMRLIQFGVEVLGAQAKEIAHFSGLSPQEVAKRLKRQGFKIQMFVGIQPAPKEYPPSPASPEP